MTREEAKKYLPIIQAYIDGKQVQWLDETGRWHDANDKLLTFYSPPSNYRIKPEQKYRPFKTKEECWQEMLKHQPFGFIVNKYNNDYCSICRVFKDVKGISGITFTNNSYSNWDMEIAFDKFNFADGTPFGIKEE